MRDGTCTFPHRDEGFDFIITKSADAGHQIIRPVQVKSKCPTPGKTDKLTYGYVGELSQVHPEMVLAMPFFTGSSSEAPSFVAYLPLSLIRPHSRGHRCQPATFKGGIPLPRRDYRPFFDAEGLALVERREWASLTIEQAGSESTASDAAEDE